MDARGGAHRSLFVTGGSGARIDVRDSSGGILMSRPLPTVIVDIAYDFPSAIRLIDSETGVVISIGGNEGEAASTVHEQMILQTKSAERRDVLLLSILGIQNK